MNRKKVPMIDYKLDSDLLSLTCTYESFSYGGLDISIHELGLARWSCRIKQNIPGRTSTRVSFLSSDKKQQISVRIPAEKLRSAEDYIDVLDVLCETGFYQHKYNLSFTGYTRTSKLKDNQYSTIIFDEDKIQTVLSSRTDDELLEELQTRQKQKLLSRPRKRKSKSKQNNIVFIKDFFNNEELNLRKAK